MSVICFCAPKYVEHENKGDESPLYPLAKKDVYYNIVLAEFWTLKWKQWIGT